MFCQDKKYGVLGLARSGIAAAYKIKELGGHAFLSEVKNKEDVPTYKQLENDFDCEFGGHTKRLLECDEWIVSPGIPLNSSVIEMGRNHKIHMISEIEFGFQIKSSDSKLIAVTGSNGKSTTASLIAHIIKESGHNCILGGNIGDSFCSFPIEKPGIDYIILEVSSFQLDLIDTFKPNIALLLNITPDHLNRYASFLDYAKSKVSIFKNQTEKDLAILNADDQLSGRLADSIYAQKCYFSADEKRSAKTDVWLDYPLIRFSNCANTYNVNEMQIRGPHNHQNAMAATLACRSAGISIPDIFEGLRSYKALKHRLQFIDKVNGIDFYNDSKATNTDSVKYALLSFEKPIRIIMGGSDKNEDFDVLTDLLKQKARAVYITGATTTKMLETWKNKLDVVAIDDFEQCIRQAFEDSSDGDVIVLSPACASYDRFKNFEERGDTFIEIVYRIAAEYEKKI